MKITDGTLFGWTLSRWQRARLGRVACWVRWWVRRGVRRLAARVWFWRKAPALWLSPRGSWSYEYRDSPRATLPPRGSDAWGSLSSRWAKESADYFIGNTVSALGKLP
jgi:hypothetical protein